MLNATQLAEKLGVSKARVSQYVSQGMLAGCYEGDGRNRRFDLSRVQSALHRNLDPAQMMGNGAQTRRTIKALAQPEISAPAIPPAPQTDTYLSPTDLDRYELARIQSAEEDARRKRRDNQRDEGLWVMAEEAKRQTAKAMSQEVAQFEVLLRDAARAVADQFALDYREVRKVLMDQWREYRGRRSDHLATQADASAMTATEQAEQV